MSEKVLDHLKSGKRIKSVMSEVEYGYKDYKNNINNLQKSIDNNNCDHYILLEPPPEILEDR